MSLFKQHREQVKKTIEEVCLRLFREKGYENVTVDEITKEVGIAKGTFYNFYSSKLDILMLWAENQFKSFDISKAVVPGATIKENLTALIRLLVAAIKQEEKMFRTFIFKLSRNYGNNPDNKFDFVKLFSLAMQVSIDYGKAGAELYEAKLHVLNSSLFLGIVGWFNSGKNAQQLEEYLLNLLTVCLYGIIEK
ncbi:MAG: TetR/AcrR family transcriptional regulator [Bacillota bacterium]|nr:TetR/AcrR family transcriptional regulator [Bacillota bacterium]